MATPQSHEQVLYPSKETPTAKPSVGFGDLKLREAEAEKTMAAAAKRLTTPEGLIRTREQMLKEQMNKVADIVVKYAEQNELLQNETSAQFKKRVLQSALITDEVSSLLNDAYAHQDSINPLAYDNQYQLPYNVVSTDFGFEIRPSESLKKEKTKSGTESLWKTQSFNLEDYVSELFSQYKDDAKEDILQKPLESVSSKMENEDGTDVVSNAAQEKMGELINKGFITPKMIERFNGLGQFDGKTALGSLIDTYSKLSSPELSLEDYLAAIDDVYTTLKPVQNNAGNRKLTIQQDGEDNVRLQIKLEGIGELGRIPTDGEIDEAFSKEKENEEGTKEK